MTSSVARDDEQRMIGRRSARRKGFIDGMVAWPSVNFEFIWVGALAGRPPDLPTRLKPLAPIPHASRVLNTQNVNMAQT